jgi:prophage maintenance system killer protein/biotin operon repressor
MKNKQTDIVIYKPKGKAPALEVHLTEDTVWLTQSQIAELFQSSRVNITEHIQHIFTEGELEQESTCRKFRLVRQEGGRKITRNIEHFNLDVIISVGYRVKSKIATHFRIWATNVLREYTVKGYALNKKRLQEREQGLDELTQSIILIQSVAETRLLSKDETRGLLQVISDYAYGLKMLDDFDRRSLSIQDTQEEVKFVLDYETARRSIDEMTNQLKKSGKELELFGVEKDDSLKGSLKSIYQTVGGKDAYSSVEEKAAHLLYFVIKNHPFVDGNKRIAALLFLWFLDENRCLYKHDGSRRIADNALVALTLMLAVSRPEDKDIMIKVIVNLINRRN